METCECEHLDTEHHPGGIVLGMQTWEECLLCDCDHFRHQKGAV